MSTFDVTFSSRLKEERIRLGLTQEKAGEICGTTREGWGRYESGKNMPGGDVLQKFTMAGADINYIFSGLKSSLILKQDIAPYHDDDINLIKEAYRSADDLGKKALMSIVELIKNKKA